MTAPGTEEAIRRFVEQVADPVRGERQLARWDRRICAGVAGMRRPYAELLNDHIGAAAARVGLTVGEPGCRPNILIYATADSDALARDLVENYPSAVSYYGFQGLTQGRDALRRFENTPRPVRWWHVTHSVTAEGVIADSSLATGLWMGDASTPANTVEVGSMGRTRRTTRQDFAHVLIILDVSRIQGVPFGAVADYVAMTALAQLDPDAPTDGYPTIMNLFADQAHGQTPVARLTDWDLAYLNGLYGSRRFANNAGRQRDDIVRSMTGQRRRGGR